MEHAEGARELLKNNQKWPKIERKNVEKPCSICVQPISWFRFWMSYAITSPPSTYLFLIC